MSAIQTVKIFTLTLLLAAPVTAHDSHSSATEIEWNPETRRFEIAMRLRIADLEDAVSVKLKTRFRFEGDPERDRHVRNYLQQNFAVTFHGHKVCRLHWVGSEMELHDVWVYFEAESVPDDNSAGKKPDSGSATARKDTDKVERWDDLFSSGPRPRGFPEMISGTSLPVNVDLRNTVLMDVQPEQVNVVVLTIGRHKSSVVLDAKTPAAQLTDSAPRLSRTVRQAGN